MSTPHWIGSKAAPAPSISFVSQFLPVGSNILRPPSFFVSLTPAGAPDWGTWYFNSGVVGVGYDESWDMPNVLPTVYSVYPGDSLPPGLALGAVTGNEGKIFGTPTAAGSYTFRLRAINGSGSLDQSFTINISAPSGGGGSAYSALSLN